jgi:pimeloyl-ACP methyl ester carboxylesterase
MNGPESGFVEANGLRLHYLAWGEADARPIVLNHATGFLAWLWEPVARPLAAAGYRVLAYDARGHGDSEKPAPTAENYDWQRCVDDLCGFLDALGLRGVPFVGHSFGGATGLYLAGTRPEYLSRLVAIEPIVMPGGFAPDETRRDEMAAGARRRRHVFASEEAMIKQYRSRPTFAKWTDEALRLYVEHGTFQHGDPSTAPGGTEIELKCSGEIEGALFANSGSLPVWDVLPKIDVPVLVMRGETTEGFLSTVAEAVAGRVPHGTLETIPDAGHLAPMERPEAVAEALLRVVDSG